MKTLLLILLLAGSTIFAGAQSNKHAMDNKKPYTILLLLDATPQWLSLTRDERSAFYEDTILPLLARTAKTVKVRLFDSEYFHARVSDFMIITAGDLGDYKLLIEQLRDTKIYGAPYFRVVDIIPGQENAFEDFNTLFKKQ